MVTLLPILTLTGRLRLSFPNELSTASHTVGAHFPALLPDFYSLAGLADLIKEVERFHRKLYRWRTRQRIVTSIFQRSRLT